MRTGTFFEINISKNGKHVFATDSSIRQYDTYQTVALLALLKEKFPPEDDYEFGVTGWHCGGIALPDEITAAIPARKNKST
jgi:hypothetical protein